MMKDDPVVQRVRAARRQIIARCGQDKRRLFEWAKQVEAGARVRIVTYQPPAKPKTTR